jgi:hypothetical protein
MLRCSLHLLTAAFESDFVGEKRSLMGSNDAYGHSWGLCLFCCFSTEQMARGQLEPSLSCHDDLVVNSDLCKDDVHPLSFSGSIQTPYFLPMWSLRT